MSDSGNNPGNPLFDRMQSLMRFILEIVQVEGSAHGLRRDWQGDFIKFLMSVISHCICCYVLGSCGDIVGSNHIFLSARCPHFFARFFSCMHKWRNGGLS